MLCCPHTVSLQCIIFPLMSYALVCFTLKAYLVSNDNISFTYKKAKHNVTINVKKYPLNSADSLRNHTSIPPFSSTCPLAESGDSAANPTCQPTKVVLHPGQFSSPLQMPHIEPNKHLHTS